MTRGALTKRLHKAKKQKSVSISIRIPWEDVAELDQIEAKTNLRYDWLIRLLIKGLLQAWKRKGSIKVPIQIAVMNYGETFVQMPISIATENAMRMIWKTDATGTNTFANGNFLSFVGKSLKEMLGDGWLEIVHPDQRSAIFEHWTEVYKQKGIMTHPFKMRRADGEYVWAFSVGVPELDPASGRLLGYNGSVFEIEPYLHRWIELLQSDISKADVIGHDASTGTTTLYEIKKTKQK